MSNKIIKPHDIAGKTVERIVFSCGEVFIKFTDGTVTGLVAERDRYDDSLEWH